MSKKDNCQSSSCLKIAENTQLSVTALNKEIISPFTPRQTDNSHDFIKTGAKLSYS